MLDSKLNKNSNSTEHRAMIIQVVSVRLMKNIESLEPPIHGLMASSIALMLNSFWRALNKIRRDADVHFFSFIAFICIHHLPGLQVHHQLLPEDCSVWKGTSRKRTIDPNDLPGYVRDADLIP